MAIKSFITFATRANIIKLFTLVLYGISH
jgi:hypothetical protein